MNNIGIACATRGHLFVGSPTCIRCGIKNSDCIADGPAPSPEPSPYEQGFRDALLTAKATAGTIAQKNDANSEAVWALEEMGIALDKLIDQKNHDLYKLLAIAQVDLSSHPEAQALRGMLRAPTGLLIDGEGRVLFIRLNGTEYGTGVMELLEQIARMRGPEMMTILVNGRERLVERFVPISYEMILGMENRATGDTVTYRGKGDLGEFSGTLTAGGSLVAPPGTIFNVTHTGSA